MLKTMERTFWGECQQCGKLLDDSGESGYDDVVSSPYVTSAGDVFCIPCGREMDQLDHGDDWDGSEA